MSDAALVTLDEIIKKKKIRPFKNQNGKAVKTKKGTKKAPVKRLGKKGPIKKGVIKDARNRIIQRKRQNMGDARERLGELAKTGDARQRLNKMKMQGRLGPGGAKAKGQAAANLLTQKKALQKKQVVVVKAAAQKAVKKPAKAQVGADLVRAVANVAGNIAKPANAAAKKKKNKNQINKVNKQMAISTQNLRIKKANRPQPVFRQPQPVFRQPQVVYQQMPAPQVVYVDEYGVPIQQYDDYYAPPPPVYVQAPMRRPAPMRVQRGGGIQQRLQPQKQQAQGGQQGHKVLVTNLRQTVSKKDMEELFRSIGKVLNARMVKQGVAEAVFMNLQDAQKCVNTFNNRQLDGFPMNVKMVKRKQAA